MNYQCKESTDIIVTEHVSAEKMGEVFQALGVNEDGDWRVPPRKAGSAAREGTHTHWFSAQHVSYLHEQHQVQAHIVKHSEGNCIHLGKGQAHAFRKTVGGTLPWVVAKEADAHFYNYNPRGTKAGVTTKKGNPPSHPSPAREEAAMPMNVINIAFAWDFAFTGYSKEGQMKQFSLMHQAVKAAYEVKSRIVAPFKYPLVRMGMQYMDTVNGSGKEQADIDWGLAGYPRYEAWRGILMEMVQEEIDLFFPTRYSGSQVLYPTGQIDHNPTEEDVEKHGFQLSDNPRLDDSHICWLCQGEFLNGFYKADDTDQGLCPKCYKWYEEDGRGIKNLPHSEEFSRTVLWFEYEELAAL